MQKLIKKNINKIYAFKSQLSPESIDFVTVYYRQIKRQFFLNYKKYYSKIINTIFFEINFQKIESLHQKQRPKLNINTKKPINPILQQQAMISRSIQQSIFDEILQLQSQSNFPSFSYEQLSSQSQINYKENNKQRTCNAVQYKNSRSLSCSITELQDQILRMRVMVNKQTNKDSNPSTSNQYRTRRSKNIKTQVSIQQDQFVPPANYSIIYTRRSSLDQSLYDKAVRESSARKEWALKKAQQKQSTQLRKCTHKPTINANSKQIMNKVDKQMLYLRMKKKKEESAQRIIEESAKRQMKQCSFTPKIRDSRNKLLKSVQVKNFNEQQQVSKQLPRNSISIFDHLYEDSKNREIRSKQLKQKQLNAQTKTPAIDEISRIITKDTNFEARMEYYQKRKLQKQLQQKQKQNRQIKQSYRPAINSSSNARHKQLSIGQHLYLQSKRESNKTKKNNNNQAQIKYVNKKSVQFYQQRKTMVFYQIFRMLDGDQDGVISINEISLDALPRQIIKIIYPLVEELEVMEVQLQEHQFINSISNLFKTLSIHEKNILLGFIGGTSKPDMRDSTFQPKINSKSKAIASINQRSHMSIYDYCSIKQAEKEKYLETERIEKTKRELQSCTFQPKIIINKRG